MLGGRGDGPRALRAGIFRYWRAPHARSASMDILSGDESGTDAFVREYLKVVSAGGAGAALDLFRARDRRTARAVRAMIGIARHVTRDAVTKAISTLAVERTPLLLPLRPATPSAPLAPTRRPAPTPPAEPPRVG